MKIKQVQEMVEVALMVDPATRDDDCVLYAAVCIRINPLAVATELGTALRNHERYGLPSFESVTRARRKVQSNHPELRPSPNASNARYKRWKEVREWASE